MSDNKLALNLVPKYQGISRGQSIVVWTITDPEDKEFKYQLQFISDNTCNFGADQLLNLLKQCIEQTKSPSTPHKLFLNKKKEFLDALEKQSGLNNIRLVQDGKGSYYIKNDKLLAEYFDPLLSLLCTDHISLSGDKALRFGYKLEEKDYPLPGGSTSINCVYFCEEKKNKLATTNKERDIIKVFNEIYLFPSDEPSLKMAQRKIKDRIEENSNIKKLEIPFVVYDSAQHKEKGESYFKDIQARIALQTIIAEILIHLKQVKSFRKDNTEKMKIFGELAENIADNNMPLTEIRNTLNQHDKWKTLSQHRDPWGLFAFFKGKTHSLVAWELLQEKVAEILKLTNTASTAPVNN